MGECGWHLLPPVKPPARLFFRNMGSRRRGGGCGHAGGGQAGKGRGESGWRGAQMIELATMSSSLLSTIPARGAAEWLTLAQLFASEILQGPRCKSEVRWRGPRAPAGSRRFPKV